MTDEVKTHIITAWNRYADEHGKRMKKNEGSTTQHEDYCKLFKKGVLEHPKLSKREKEEVLARIGFAPAPA